MKIVIAMDSFKGCMTSLEAGNAAKDGAKRVFPEAEILVRPMADGGEGTVEALTPGLGGVICTAKVQGPLGREVDCRYGIVEQEKLGIIEMAGAAGITLITPKERNPMAASTYGAGQVILEAVKAGCRRFLMGIGGSATNDGGLGMLRAFGYEFVCEEGNLAQKASDLDRIVEIRREKVVPELEECVFRVACDVTNPLCGPSGASAVFGPQKGATPEMIRQLDLGLEHFAEVTRRFYPAADAAAPGTGAAGGLGFAFLAYTNAVLEPGIRIVLEETRLEDDIAQADMVITGEGRLDGQSVMGKAPVGVAGLAKKYGKKVLAFSGSVAEEARACNKAGIDAYFPILREVVTLEEAMEKERAQKNMRDAVEQAMRLL
nr:glycerate kinase [uncultured Acetatifactor sp.]